MENGIEKMMAEEKAWSSQTLDYYNKHADAFSRDTFDVKFTQTQETFLSLLKPHSCILDFGCGSGRDTRYFLQKGYCVEAVDGSEKMCEIATKHTGIQVRQMLFQDLKESDKYDGIWACSSILHLSKNELLIVMSKMIRALKKQGIIYTSFKYGNFEGNRNGRYFTNFTEESFVGFLRKSQYLREQNKSTDTSTDETINKHTNENINKNINKSINESMKETINETIKEGTKNFEVLIEKIWITGDARPGREDEKWLNLILRKI